jgi:hypothetical protein
MFAENWRAPDANTSIGILTPRKWCGRSKGYTTISFASAPPGVCQDRFCEPDRNRRPDPLNAAEPHEIHAARIYF